MAQVAVYEWEEPFGGVCFPARPGTEKRRHLSGIAILPPRV